MNYPFDMYRTAPFARDSAIGELHATLGDAGAARFWYGKSLEAWKNLESQGGIPAMYSKEPARVAALIHSMHE